MKKITKAVILAGGLNSRLMPIAKAIPKALLPVEEKPLIQHLIEECVNSGIKEIIIVVRNKDSLIEKYLKPNSELEKLLKEFKKFEALEELKKLDRLVKKCELHFVRQKRPLGEAHAIACAKNYVKGENFAVLLGDTAYKTDEPVTKQLINKFYVGKRTILRTGRFILTPSSFEYLAKFNYEDPQYKDKNTLHMLGTRKTSYVEVAGAFVDGGTFPNYVSAVELFEKKK